MKSLAIPYILVLIKNSICFWDKGTQTPHRADLYYVRTSFFEWQRVAPDWMRYWTPQWNWDDLMFKRKLNVVAGISIDFIPLGVATILNRRALLSSANFFEPYLTRQRDLRIWALGSEGRPRTPYRYRVWRVRRIRPKSLNPEHQHGPRGIHVPRHDLSIIHSWDMIYIYPTIPTKYHNAYRAKVSPKHALLGEILHFAGSGYKTLRHIRENYSIQYSNYTRNNIVDCSNYLPKWWGKFICIQNIHSFAGVPSGGGLFYDYTIAGVGCFEIRYNEDRIMVFTDIRYYTDAIYLLANYTPGQYYEYAYPQWGVRIGFSSGNQPYIPRKQVQYDLYPLGRR